MRARAFKPSEIIERINTKKKILEDKMFILEQDINRERDSMVSSNNKCPENRIVKKKKQVKTKKNDHLLLTNSVTLNTVSNITPLRNVFFFLENVQHLYRLRCFPLMQLIRNVKS